MGVSSGGLTTMQLPAASACAANWPTVASGLFQGMMPAITPYGSRTL